MPSDANQIVVAANGLVSVAAVGTTAPTDPTTTLPAGWVSLGFVSEAGVKFKDEKTIADINGWQSFYPLRKIITAKAATLEFELIQFQLTTIQLAFGGGTFTQTGSPPKFTYHPPSPSSLDSRALCVDWQDGTKNYRLYLPKGLVQDAVETQLVRTDNLGLPIVFAATPVSSSVDAYTLFTDDPSFSS